MSGIFNMTEQEISYYYPYYLLPPLPYIIFGFLSIIGVESLRKYQRNQIGAPAAKLQGIHL